jgi:hypothetical protein
MGRSGEWAASVPPVPEYDPNRLAIYMAICRRFGFSSEEETDSAARWLYRRCVPYALAWDALVEQLSVEGRN